MKILSKNIKRLLLLGLCVATLSGCATKMAYHYLDFVLLWYFEGYVKLDSDQKDYVKKELDEFHYWHRTSQLPRYALYLESLKIRLSTGKLTGTELHRDVDELQVLLDDSLAHLLPIMVEVVATFSDEQVEELLQSVAKDRDDYRKKFIDVDSEKRHKARIGELRNPLDLLISKYNDEQKGIMRAWSEHLVPFEKLTLKQQEIWGEDLAAVLKERNDKTKLDSGLRRLIFVHTDHWEPELQEIVDSNQATTYQAIADIINSLDAKQRSKMNTKLDNYAQDFRELAVALNKKKD